MYVHTYIHTYIQTYIHTYIHTYINCRACPTARGRVYLGTILPERGVHVHGILSLIFSHILPHRFRQEAGHIALLSERRTVVKETENDSFITNSERGHCGGGRGKKRNLLQLRAYCKVGMAQRRAFVRDAVRSRRGAGGKPVWIA
jgi:hypothetical protein